MKTPAFWYDRHAPIFLLPLSWMYRLGRFMHVIFTSPKKCPIPSVCVGNITAGGAGKTPVTIAITALLNVPGTYILSRGYGGAEEGPVRVRTSHTAIDIGDEPALMARYADVVVAKDRLAGAQYISERGGILAIMDDGLQNRDMSAHVNIVVIDGNTGFGNGACLPAGPLREGIHAGLSRAHAVVIIGNDNRDIRKKIPAQLSVFTARPHYKTSHLDQTYVYIAFAGIARPQKFYDALAAQNISVIGVHDFNDHHPYTAAEIEALIERAFNENARLITTEKDRIRIPERYHDHIDILPMSVVFDEPQAFRSHLIDMLKVTT